MTHIKFDNGMELRTEEHVTPSEEGDIYIKEGELRFGNQVYVLRDTKISFSKDPE